MSGGIAERHRKIQRAEATASELHDATLVPAGRFDESRESRSGLSGARVRPRCGRQGDVRSEAQDQRCEKSERNRNGRGKSVR